MAVPDANDTATLVEDAVAAARPKRVRTGCLTCRERHLKCDEGLPHCQNCRKSSRVCKRGVRLNFIDTQVQKPPYMPLSHEWSIDFKDESREIAAEYKGGLGRYSALRTEEIAQMKEEAQFEMSQNMVVAPTMSHQQLPPIHALPAEVEMNSYPEPHQNIPDQSRESHHHHTHSNADSTYSSTLHASTQSTFSNSDQILTPPNEARDWLNQPEEVLFMQVFVEEVGSWMDSMDPHKHFSRLLPFHSLIEPMLLNAFLACGAKHLTLVNPAYQEDKALHYYNKSTTGLLNQLQNPERDTVICATTAVILNVYEIMSERALQRMNHIAGARALIKECGWNARSTGIGGACFWLNIGMELLSCLHFNWQVAWDPDDWGVDMNITRETKSGQEELWTYRIVYIVAKIANFRASIPRAADSNPATHNLRQQDRLSQWRILKDWCDSWNENIPRTMHPMAYLYPYQTSSKSAFPEVWLIKRATITARLFYHTAMTLLAQIHPERSTTDPEMHEMQLSHSHQICGIAAHVKDRGVASVALRSLAIAAECLINRREQEEVLQMLEKIRKETGWRIGFLNPELKEKWGWNNEETYQQQQQQQQQQHMGAAMMQHATAQSYQYQQQQSSTFPRAAQNYGGPGPRPGIVNPLMRTADFTYPTHPYQNYYVAPSQAHQHNTYTNYYN